MLCSLEEYKEKLKNRCLEDAIAFVKQFYENTGKYPTIEQMGDGFAWLYLPRTKDVISKYPHFFDLLGDNSEAVKKDFLNSTAMFNSYEEFLEYVKGCK